MEKFPEDNDTDLSGGPNEDHTQFDLISLGSPRADLIDTERYGHDGSDSEALSKLTSVKEAVVAYLSEQRSALRRNAQDVIEDIDALANRENWTFDEHFASTVTVLTQANAFLNTLGESSADVERAIQQLADDAKKAAPPPTEESNKLVSFGASSLMYLLTFFLGRWLTTATGCGILLSGAGGQVALAVLMNNLVVPLTQAMLGDPMGTALRNYGPNVPSEDSRQYANFMTAHAVYVRSCISGISPTDYDPVVEMDRVINEVVWREQGRPDPTTNEPTTKGTWFPSGVSMTIHPKQPAGEVTAALKAAPYSGGQRARVVGSMLARILVSDEAPVHTFSFYNGVTGLLSGLWPTLFGATASGLAVARVVDAAMHTTAGTFAMFVMFQIQDYLRPIVQSAQRVDPTDEEYLKLKMAPYVPIILAAGNKQDSVKEVAEALTRLQLRLKSAQDSLGAGSLRRDGLVHLQRQVKRLYKLYKKKVDDYQDEIDTAHKDVQILDSPAHKLARGVLDTWRVFSGKTAKSTGKSWTDGSPSVVRAASKYLGYATALVPSTVLSIEVSKGIGDAYQTIRQQVANSRNSARPSAGVLTPSNPTEAQAQHRGSAIAWQPPAPVVTASDVTLTPEQIASAQNPYMAASAFNATLAIAGWNLRNVAFDPMFQHVIHAGIGLAERGLSMCCGYGRTDGATATAVDLTGQHQPDLQLGSQEIEERLARIEANLRLSADELRRLGSGVMGDGPVTEDTGLGDGNDVLQASGSQSTTVSDGDPSSPSGSNNSRMD